MKANFIGAHLFFMQFIMPAALENVPAVYKITIDDQWFYIGSSKSLKKRIWRWKCSFAKPRHLKNSNIKRVFTDSSKIEFSVIERVDTTDSLRSIETRHIQANWDDPGLLNLCPSGENYFGRRKPMGWVEKFKNAPTPPKPVAQFDFNGPLLRIFPSLRAASRELEMDMQDISAILKGKRGPTRSGTTFKQIKPDGSYIDPPVFIKKPSHQKGCKCIGKTGAERSQARKVAAYTLDGVLVKVYGAITVAAKEVGTKHQHIHAVLRGERRSCKGYVWKSFIEA